MGRTFHRKVLRHGPAPLTPGTSGHTHPPPDMQPLDWSSLSHAYGSAADVPALLDRARVAPPPGSYGDEPWFSLWSALVHQGDVFTASYAALPRLVDIAEARRREPRVAAECLYLAASIEMERGAPITATEQPALQPQLAGPYRGAIRRGAGLTAEALAGHPDDDARDMLEVAAAVFAGDLERARLLVDGRDGEE